MIYSRKTNNNKQTNAEDSSVLVFLLAFVYNKLGETHSGDERAIYHSLLIQNEELLLLYECLNQAAASL